tara:strand:- start:7133 stop:7612 length:480 start_codon:yes stop_codon:yes gene_type:complete
MKWIVVQTKSNSEQRAVLNLKNQGFKVFFPRVCKTKVFFRTAKRVLKPLFPGYIFVQLIEDQKFLKINNTFGVKNIIKLGGKIYFLPLDIYQKIKLRCNENDICYNFFEKGEKVIIKKNKFFIEGIFDEYVDEKRSTILLNLMEREVKTSVAISAIGKY